MLISKAIANTFAGLLGGMPICHGAGGLTAHYRFGARTGGATVMLGVILLVLALGFGAGSAEMLALIPLPVLGALLGLVGLQHSLLARDVRGWSEVGVTIAIAAVGLSSGNLAFGFLAGMLADQSLRLAGRLRLKVHRPTQVPPQLDAGWSQPDRLCEPAELTVGENRTPRPQAA